VGGGIAGLCAAVSAARNGIKVALMQDRPVLGGNASSEIRMWICGAHGDSNRETGIVEEICLENYYRNTNLSFSIWDSVLYEKARFEPNITLLLNCTCIEAATENNEIKSVKGWQLTSETYHTVNAEYFADCSGDGVLAPLTNAGFMLGREAKSKFNETIPPDTADKKTMGMSCLLQARETDRPQKYIPPSWAYKYETDDELPDAGHGLNNNFWWIELGGDRDSIHDTEELRDELLKIAFGVWDHIKNKGGHGAENWALDWVGFLPGKRESRRYVGEYIITENDVTAGGKFDDIAAYAGWTMDDHFPAGFYYRGGHPTIYHPAPSPWGITFRALYSKNIKNLFFAGRNISVTHAALSSSRVMATCGILGQAVGTAAALCVKENIEIRKLDITKLQQQLMYDDCWIPFSQREVPPLTKEAKTNAPVLQNGFDRPVMGEYNGFCGDFVEYTFENPVDISEIRLVFDSDLNRKYKNMPCQFLLDEPDYKTPKTLIKYYKILADGGVVVENNNNYQRMVKHQVKIKAKNIKFIPIETWGDSQFRIFAFDVK
jgi:hypothetical protein